MPKKLYTTQRPLGKNHEVQLDKELYLAERDLGFNHRVELTKDIHDVDALKAFFLLTESGDFISKEQGGRLVTFYG